MSVTERKPEEINAEIRETRDRMDETLNALQDRFSPADVLDRGLGYLKNSSNGGMGYMNNLGRAVQQNPLPVTVIGVGLLWLMASNRSGGHEHHRYRYPEDYDAYDPMADDPLYYGQPYDPDPELYYGADYDPDLEVYHNRDTGVIGGDGKSATDRLKEGAQHTGESIAGAASQAKHSTASGTSQAKHSASNTAAHAKHSASSSAAQAKGYAASAGERTRAGAEGMRHRMAGMAGSGRARMDEARYRADLMRHRAGSKARLQAMKMRHTSEYYGQRAREGFGYVLEEQPLVLGAVGMALGALLGSLLPSTRQEDEYFGPTRDEMLEAAREEGQRMARRAEDVAASAADAEARKQNLTGQGAASETLKAEEKVENVAKAAKDAAKDETAKKQEEAKRDDFKGS